MGRKERNLFFAPLILNRIRKRANKIQRGSGKRKMVSIFEKKKNRLITTLLFY